MKNRLHPALYGFGIGEMLLGVGYPTLVWDMMPEFPIWGYILLALVTLMFYYGYLNAGIFAEQKKKFKLLEKENLFLTKSNYVFKMGLITGVIFLFIR